MTQNEKIKIILKGLYKDQHSGNYYTLKELYEELTGLSMSFLEAQNLGIYMKNLGYVNMYGGPAGPNVEIRPEGINYIEPELLKEEDREVILLQARRMFSDLNRGSFNLTLDEFKDELEKELWNYEIHKDQLIYLNELKNILEKGLIVHKEKCTNTGHCFSHESYRMALFLVRKKIDKLREPFDFTMEYTPSDPVTPEEAEKIHEKLDMILERLKVVELGQQITYDDIESQFNDVKELIPLLGKQNIWDLIKGKLFELTVSKVISLGTLKELYEMATGQSPTSLLQ